MFSFFRLLSVMLFGSSARRAQKRMALSRMRRIQRIMEQERLHQLEKDNASLAGKVKSQGSRSKLTDARKSHSSKTWAERSLQKQDIKEKQRDRKGRSEALKKASTIRERVKRSRERGRDLWSQGM